MIERSALTAMILLLLPGMPLVAQDAGEGTEPVDDTEVVDSTGGAESVETAPHPHEGFDFPSQEIEDAADAGLTWLRLVDAEEYAEAWATGSATLQGSATPQQLKSSINRGRQPFRPLGSRSLIGIQELDNPPNAPPGDYLMLQYRTAVSGDETIIETVVSRREGDAARVAGYFIQRE